MKTTTNTTTNKDALRKTSAMVASLMMVAVSANAIVVSAAQPARPELAVDTISGEAGQSVDVNVMVNGNFDFSYFGTKLAFDGALNYTGCDVGQSSVNKVGGTISVEESYMDDDVITMCGYTSALQPAKSGTLVTLHFDIPRSAEPGTIYNIGWYDIDEFGNGDEEYTPQIVDGSITVVSDYELGYKVKNGEASITGCEGDPTKVKIPEYYKGFPVKSIAKDAFGDCDRLEEVQIPDQVENINSKAFDAQSKLDVKGSEDTAAETFAETNKYTFVAQGESAITGYRIDVDQYKFEFSDSVSFTKDNIHVVSINESGKETPVDNWNFGTSPEEIYENGAKKVKVSIELDGNVLGYVSIDMGIKGNITDSGKITARDASTIFSAYKEAYNSGEADLTTRQQKLADVDDNGAITAKDAAQTFASYKTAYRAGK